MRRELETNVVKKIIRIKYEAIPGYTHVQLTLSVIMLFPNCLKNYLLPPVQILYRFMVRKHAHPVINPQKCGQQSSTPRCGISFDTIMYDLLLIWILSILSPTNSNRFIQLRRVIFMVVGTFSSPIQGLLQVLFPIQHIFLENLEIDQISWQKVILSQVF